MQRTLQGRPNSSGHQLEPSRRSITVGNCAPCRTGFIMVTRTWRTCLWNSRDLSHSTALLVNQRRREPGWLSTPDSRRQPPSCSCDRFVPRVRCLYRGVHCCTMVLYSWASSTVDASSAELGFSPLLLTRANSFHVVRSMQDGNSPAPLPSANGHPTSNGDGGNWLSDGRWKALRRLGSTSGWLIDPTEVSLGKVSRGATGDIPQRMSDLCPDTL